MKKFLSFVFVAVMATVSLVAYFAWQSYTQFIESSIQLNDGENIYNVKKGSTFSRVATELEEEGVITSKDYFRVLAKINQQENKLKAGEYQLTAEMKPNDLLKMLTSGRSLQYKQTIIEGKSFNEMAASIRKNPHLVHTLSDDEYGEIMQKLEGEVTHPEGMFLADTYNFPRGTTDLQFLKRSYDELQEHLLSAWDGRDEGLPLESPYDALILASIVEKETGHEDERGMIARVFINRLNKGMMLQTDPTVIYGMGDKYKGNIRKKDLRTDTPYNTYTRAGLPPTPIAIPGKASIDAVMHPAEGDVYYFVAKGDGTSYFSKNYKEHKRAVVKYILNGNASRYTGGK